MSGVELARTFQEGGDQAHGPAKIRITLAEDHAVVRAGIKLLLETQPDMEVVGEAGDGQGAWQQALELQPQVVVMDIGLPGLDGAEATRQIKAQAAHIQVVVLTVHEERAYLRELLQAGASGYVQKRAGSEELLNAIRAAAQGHMYLDRAATAAMAAEIVDSGLSLGLGELAAPTLAGDGSAPAVLSKREREVLVWIARGHSNKEIAAQMRISVKTLETYKYRAMSKLGLHSRADIVRYVVAQGWLQDA